MPPKDMKKEIDPEELMRRKFLAKCRFRALIRMVLANLHWLIEDVDRYEGVDDVKRRVAQAVRGRTRKQLLSIKDKALLNKPAEHRTDSEKKYLYRIIGGLKCFKRYPNHVKRKLAALTYFKYYGPGRVIVKQHQPGYDLYFIVSGEVIVTQMMYDGLLDKYQPVEIARLGTGDMFGEISLLHDVPRTATVTTADHCELLQLEASDFKKVLLTSIQKQWDEVENAMSMFTYFEQLDAISSREGCIVAKMKSFEPNEVILGDGCGIPNHVYFLLSGRVQMIENLQVIVVKGLDKTFYFLHDPYVTPEESEVSFDTKWFSVLHRDSLLEQQMSRNLEKGILKRSPTTTSSRKLSSKTSSSKSTFEVESKRSSLLKYMQKEESDAGSSYQEEGQIKAEGDMNSEVKINTEEKENEGETKAEGKTKTEGERKSGGEIKPKEESKTDNEVIAVEVHREESIRKPKIEEGDVAVVKNAARSSSFEGIKSRKVSVPPLNPYLASGKGKMRTYFMQVCQMNKGSTFGFGENMRDRRIVALTPVSCMLLPKVWLLQKNIANIWTRIQYYLEKKIPNKAQLFEEFQRQRDWLSFREECVQDVITRSHTANDTSIHDVPYAIRMEEMIDI